MPQQGDFEAKGDWTPKFKATDKATFYPTNSGMKGYGCVCMRAEVDKEMHRILAVHSIQIKKLKVCRQTAGLPKPE